MTSKHLLTAFASIGALLLVTAAVTETKGYTPATGISKQFGQSSGFEGMEEKLGQALSEAIKNASTEGSARHDFSGREEMLGRAVSTVIKTLNQDEPYQHEMNDALLKMTLGHIYFAKKHGMLVELIEDQSKIVSGIRQRVGKRIKETGNRELALIGMTTQTPCFYQLVDEFTWEPGKITYKSPFIEMAEITQATGQYDLTAQEIHEIWTIPNVKAAAESYGVALEISEWRDDGIITISLAQES